MARKANDSLLSASLRHQVAVRRFTAGEVKKMIRLLEEADRELVEKIRSRLARLGGVRDFTTKRWKALLESVREARKEAIDAVRGGLTRDLAELAKVEATAEVALMRASIPLQVDLASVDLRQIGAAALARPFEGRRLGEWFEALRRADQAAITRALQLGMAQGESIPNIARRLAGGPGDAFKGGTLAQTRRQTEAVVRTGVNHVSNAAREAVWEENSDIVAYLRWTSTLDGRTTPVCQARDGALVPLGGREVPDGEVALDPPGARPPAHVNCRSVMVAVLDETGVLGKRAAITDTRTRREREVDFRAQAKEEGRSVAEVREEWASENIGQLPAKTTYNQWLKDQSAEFQDEVLGPTRGALFRRGGLDVQEFTDRAGNELTLDELRAREPGAFDKAGL